MGKLKFLKENTLSEYSYFFWKKNHQNLKKKTLKKIGCINWALLLVW
jgi:hypothetical protein